MIFYSVGPVWWWKWKILNGICKSSKLCQRTQGENNVNFQNSKIMNIQVTLGLVMLEYVKDTY